MWNLLRAELLKLRRCQILLVGLVALGLCPLVQYGSQMIIEAEYRDRTMISRRFLPMLSGATPRYFCPFHW